MELSDYCEVPEGFDEASITQEEKNALMQEIARVSSMKPMCKDQGKFNTMALEELVKAVYDAQNK